MEPVREVEEERGRDDGDEGEVLHDPALHVLDDDVPDHVRRALAGVEGVLERLEDVLPADDDERVDPRVAEEVGDGVLDDAVALVLELLQRDELLLDAVQPLQLGRARWPGARRRRRGCGTAPSPAAIGDSTP